MPIDDKDLPVIDGAEQETLVSDRGERAERIDDRHPRDRVAGREKGRDMRSIIKSAIKEHDPAAQADQSTKPAAGEKPAGTQAKPEDRGASAASPAAKEIPETPKTGETVAETAPQAPAAVAAPAALSKEVKAIWDTLPEAAKAEFVRREADTAKGVEQLKQRYKPIDDAFAPIRGQLQQLGKTEAEAASQLISWQAALANPRTQAEAFRALAKAHGFNLATLGSQASAGSDGQNPQSDPTQAFRAHLDPLSQKVNSLETELQRRDRERVQNDIASFSSDKPHFDKVSIAMGHLINSGLAKGSNPKEVFDDAYARACRADPEIFDAIQQEEQSKREAETKATAEAAAKKAAEDAEALKRKQAEEVARARKAGISPRGGAPIGMAIAASSKGQSVRDSIKASMKEAGAVI